MFLSLFNVVLKGFHEPQMQRSFLTHRGTQIKVSALRLLTVKVFTQQLSLSPVCPVYQMFFNNFFLFCLFFWLVCAESLVISVIDLSGNSSKSTSGPFSNIAAQPMITWRGSCTTRYENPAATRLLMTPFSRWLNSSEFLWFSRTIKARWLKNKKKWKGKGTSEMYMMHYSSQGEVCIMGMKRIYQKLKANVRCVKAREQYISQMSDSCPCTEADFEWWVPCSAATLFTSLNPMHNTLSISRGTVCEAKLRHNKRSAARLIFYNSQLLSLISVTSLVTWDVKTMTLKQVWRILMLRLWL